MSYAVARDDVLLDLAADYGQRDMSVLWGAVPVTFLELSPTISLVSSDPGRFLLVEGC